MIIVQNVLLSDEIIEEHFLCNLTACKGCCCWEGDFGAGLEEEEIDILKEEYKNIAPYLTEAGRTAIEEKGVYDCFKDEQDYGTPLLKNGACVYLTFDEQGIGKCGIEAAYNDGATSFKKPISCHLYPIRIKKPGKTNYEIMNYDRWDICSAACTLGREKQLTIYEFVKDALIRKYGEAFYEELDALAQELKKKQPEE